MTNSPIDLEVFSELSEATGEEFAAELVTTFLDEAPGMIADLKAAVAENDSDGYRRAAHSLKSNAATFGATELAELARGIELGSLPRNGEWTEADALQSTLDAAAEALRDLIHD
jgi:histidine phosphotransfer protein HptB